MFAKKGLFDDDDGDDGIGSSRPVSTPSSTASRSTYTSASTATTTADDDVSNGALVSRTLQHTASSSQLDDNGVDTPAARQAKMLEMKRLHEAKRKQKSGGGMMMRTDKAAAPPMNSEARTPVSRTGPVGGASFTRAPSTSQLGPNSTSPTAASLAPNGAPGVATGSGVGALLAEREREKERKTISAVEQQMMASGIAPIFDPVKKLSPVAPTKLDFTDMRTFLTTAIPRGVVLQCYINRNKKGMKNKLYPTYELYLDEEDRFLLAAKKRSKNKTSNYIISQDAKSLGKDSASYLGKLRSNFVGTEFVIYDKGINPKQVEAENESISALTVRQELGVVCYESNILGSRGPRKMSAIVPAVRRDGARIPFKAAKADDTIASRFKADQMSDLILLQNKTPKWNEQVGAYVLNFQGRVTMASVKNFQLIHADERI